MKELTRTQWLTLLSRSCNKGKHKLRTNNFGVTWCVNCGLLSTAVNAGDELKEEDKIKIKNEEEDKTEN